MSHRDPSILFLTVLWICLLGVPAAWGADCNSNGIDDSADIAGGSASDCDSNSIPDECIESLLWADGFEEYTAGEDVIDQGGDWFGWDANTNAGGLVVTEQFRSGSKSLAVAGSSDIVQSIANATSGSLVISAWQYIPSDFVGKPFFILLFKYNDNGPYGWSTQVMFDSFFSEVAFRRSSSPPSDVGRLPLSTDRWVQIKVIIDLDRNFQSVIYDGHVLGIKEWTTSTNLADLKLDAINLYANGSSTIYYDDISLTRVKARDCQGNGIPDACEIADGAALDQDSNGHIDVCERLVFVDENGQGANNGSSWMDAYPTLQDALNDVHSSSNYTRVRIAGGTYEPDRGMALAHASGDIGMSFDFFSDVALLGGYAGSTHPDPNFRDTREFETRLTGDLLGDDGLGSGFRSDNSNQVLVIRSSVRNAEFDGLTIEGGTAHNGVIDGSGCDIRGGVGLFRRCMIRDNIAYKSGGVRCANGGHVELHDCRLLYNISTISPAGGSPGWGGAAYVTELSTAIFNNCLFSGNYAGQGSVIAGYGAQAIAMNGCTLSGNSSLYGGSGLYFDLSVTPPTITNSILWGNTASIPGGIGELPLVRNSVFQYGFPFGNNIITQDPLFIDADGPDDIIGTIDDDVRLAANSPAIDAGSNGDVPFGVVVDLDGNPRFNNCAVDMGALEHALAAPDDSDGDGYTNNCDLCPDTEMGVVVNDTGCEIRFPLGDCNANGVFDVTDAAGIDGCVFGPGAGMGPGCDCLDFDIDGDADLRDYSIMQILLGGGLGEADLIDAVLSCTSGPEMLTLPFVCDPIQAILADRDGDGDVDLIDFAILQTLL